MFFKEEVSKNKVFIFISTSFLLFVFLWNIFKYIYINFVILCFLLIIFINFLLYYKKYFIYIISFIFWAILWIFFSYYSNLSISNKLSSLESFYNIQTKIIAQVEDISKFSDFKTEDKIKLIKLSTDSFSSLNTSKKDDINNTNLYWLINIPSNFKIKKWDIIEIEWKIEKIENFNSSFDYKNYLLSKGIYFKINSSKINIIWKIKRNFIVDKVDRVRQKLLDTIYKLYPKEEAIFLAWILLWARESVPEDLKIDFNNSWLTHLIAVSGFNITILIVFLSFFLKIFPSFLRFIFISFAIWIFVILVWDSISVLRAALMWIIWYYIAVSWRVADNLTIVLFVLVIMVFISPLSLNYDISLHLSFLAVLGILYTQKYFEKLFYFLPNFLAIKESFVLTLSALSSQSKIWSATLEK